MDWRKEFSKVGWTVRIGAGVLLLGAAIDLVYHALFLTVLPVPGAVGDATAYVGHGLTFIGMLITLGGILYDGWRNSGHARDHTLQRQSHPLRHHVSIRRER